MLIALNFAHSLCKSAMKHFALSLFVCILITSACSAKSADNQPVPIPDMHLKTPELNSGNVPKNNVQSEGETIVKNDEQMTIDDLGYQTDTFATESGKSVSFHCIKHGSLRIQFDNLEFQIDPVEQLDGNDTDYAAFPKADYILVTHEHYDHLDENAIAKLEKQDTAIITNNICAQKLGRGIVMANGDSKILRDDIKIEAVPAYNTTSGHEKFHPKGRDNGFILTLDGFRIYIAADTENIPEMANIKDIDVAFMPCNQPYTMTPQQLAKAAAVVAPKVLFPYHFSNTPKDQMKSALAGSDIDLRIRNYQ